MPYVAGTTVEQQLVGGTKSLDWTIQKHETAGRRRLQLLLEEMTEPVARNCSLLERRACEWAEELSRMTKPAQQKMRWVLGNSTQAELCVVDPAPMLHAVVALQGRVLSLLV
jgi:hypothetical protein